MNTCPHCGFELDDDPRDVQIYNGLAPAHKKTLRLLVVGMHPKDIAKEFGIAHDTVRGYLHQCFLKTGMDNRRALVSFIIRRPTLLRLIKELK